MPIAENARSFSDMTLAAVNAALYSGDILRQGFHSHYKIEEKEGIHNLVTEYDLLSEKALISFLDSAFPASSFLSEEKGEIKGGADKWIIDPLDGTVNFAHGIPVFAVSIAMQKDEEILLGVIYQPITHELFVAEKGKGAFLNGKKIQVSETGDLKKAFLATGLPYNLYENPNHCIDTLVNALKKGLPVRRLGAAAIDLAYVAAGRFDGFFETGLQPWDCAAGKLLIEESGGQISDWKGDKLDIFARKTLLAGNKKIHKELISLCRF